ncbi:MAG: GTPase Era [Myxococcota bacterium]
MTFKSGFVALVGRPNVGKSTLVNRLLGEKVSIVSPKAQTTRNRIHAILNREDAQVVFVDTPGLTAPKDALRKALRSVAGTAAADSDAVLVVVEVQPKDPSKISGEDEAVLKTASSGTGRVVVALNKIDRLPQMELALPWIAGYAERTGAAVVPVSALRSDGLDALMEQILEQLPEGPPLFPTDMHTDQAERFLVAELVREQLLYKLRDEVPHSCHVVVEVFEDSRDEDGGMVHIEGRIVVERDSQKGIVVGKKGATIKEVSTKAREQMEAVLHAKVFLRLQVTVAKNWTQDPRAIQKYGFNDPSAPSS